MLIKYKRLYLEYVFSVMAESPFEIDVEKLLSQILMIATEDSQITDEENALLTSITKGLKEYEDLLKKHIEE